MSTRQLRDIYKNLDEQRQAQDEATKNRKKGDKAEGKITDIQTGVLRDFVGEDSLKEWRNMSPDNQVMQLSIESPDGTKARKIMTFSTHKNSNIQRYKDKYNKYPDIGDAYPLRFDGDYWQPDEL